MSFVLVLARCCCMQYEVAPHSDGRIHCLCRLGVLVEVNCETDFVARGDQFKELVSNIAMQVPSII